MVQCRIGTLELFEGIDEVTFRRQAHSEFSPVGWHLGHIAFTEAYWILQRCAGLKPIFSEYHQLFAADGLPKKEREKLPPLSEIYHYLDTVRTQVFTYLKTAPLDQQERLWRWLLQHESQHSETIGFVLQLQRWHLRERHQERWVGSHTFPSPVEPPAGMIEIPAGEFEMGNESIEAMDNERPRHRVYLDAYQIDCYPVTCGEYRGFIEAGGYQSDRFWSAAGWKWLQDNPVAQPLYWSDNPLWDNHPVCGVSWYEAEAYAKFVGKRLPTEAEWEKAASWDAAIGHSRTYPWGDVQPSDRLCNHSNTVGQTTPVNAHPAGQSVYGCYDMLGNVWEWTVSWFDDYEGFTSYPYRGYSQAYFDGKHRVLKGGSWATPPWAMRSSFRNWYYPGVRQILAGFRCACSSEGVHSSLVKTPND
ncbi:ergothioneine biosynthesis protein EgtB [Coleofasciculus sp. LEGE 07092]|nr:ergothioneine biosynthesis protein EgtB [Coleofasciculus sp. LEGE 07081]MBE9149944.1 ergothioneine biosynthesis protein EgtB [Coleofasciculus sp. LEGE 07092]